MTSRPAIIAPEQYPPSSYGGGGGTQTEPQNPARQPSLNITFSQGPRTYPGVAQTYAHFSPTSPGNGYNQNPDFGTTTGDVDLNPGLGIVSQIYSIMRCT